MLAAPVTLSGDSTNGLRPVNPAKDVRQILALLDSAFGPIVDSRGRRLVKERNTISHTMPFLLRLSKLSRGFIPGFVWEENGRIVGNISLIESPVPGRYLIANVAVHPDYRRRGMARTLVAEAVEHIKSRRGQEILLQVVSDNDGAIQLYRNFGFNLLGAMSRWEASTSRLKVPSSSAQPSVLVRPLRKSEWRDAFVLDRSTVKPDLNWPVPPKPDKYDMGLRRRIGNMLNARSVESWVTDTAIAPDLRARRRLTGLAFISSEWGRPHQVDLRVDPSWQNSVQRPLLAKVIHRLKQGRSGRVVVNHPADDESTNRLLQAANFRVKRTLTVMRLDLISKTEE